MQKHWVQHNWRDLESNLKWPFLILHQSVSYMCVLKTRSWLRLKAYISRCNVFVVFVWVLLSWIQKPTYRSFDDRAFIANFMCLLFSIFILRACPKVRLEGLVPTSTCTDEAVDISHFLPYRSSHQQDKPNHWN